MKNSLGLSKSIILSCFLAGCLEIYDFVIFGFLANVLHKNYFIFLDENTALTITYILFAIGFIFRPLGSILFGYIGDKFGRKKALVLSVSLMGIASLGMSLMPSYEVIGIYACYMIALVRIIQGISVGGEYSGAIIYAVEHFDKKNTGIVGSIIVSGCLCGVLLAISISSLLKLPDIPDYSWRGAFLIGFLLSIVGYFIRRKLTETPEFLLIKNKSNKLPLFSGLKQYKLEALITIFLSAANGINLYYVTVYLPNYLKQVLKIDIWFLSIVTTLIMIISSPFFGWLSDKINRVTVIAVGVGLMAIYNFMMLPLILEFPNLSAICFIFIIHALIHSIQAGPMNTFIIEIFPTNSRFSCSAFCYSIGMGIVGGTSPMMATIITNNFDNPTLFLGLYVGGIAFLGFCGICYYYLKQKTLHKTES